jgi:ATP-binding cassette subfamily A (ABC1) protein 5
MEEADALCSRVAIMVNGRLQYTMPSGWCSLLLLFSFCRALGSTQHLKNKYGTGYTLEVKLSKSDAAQELEAFVQSLFVSATLSEKFGERFTFKIDQENVGSLANVFDALEKS